MIIMAPGLRLEPPAYEHAAQFAQWLNDPEIVKYSEQRHRQHTTESQRDYWRSTATVEPNCVYTIHGTGAPIGSISAVIDQNNNVANVGIMIGDKSAWGQGYGFEAWECFCNYLIVEKSIRKIEAGCMNINGPMNRICIKYGMKHEATIPQHFLASKGLPVSMNLYGKIAR